MSPQHVVSFESLELCLLCLAIVWAILLPRLGAGAFAALEKRCRVLARNEKQAVLMVGLLAFSTSAATSLFIHWPQPRVPDEFSYLLAADTFAHERLSNSPHPMWRHFESFHIIQQPTYASKYPPAQGLFLAIGKVLSGHPIVGVWISAALACGSICWMLQAWLSPGWALLGGFFSILRMCFLGFSYPGAPFGYFSQSYWGGAVAAMSGAVALGAARRMAKEPSLHHSLMIACGLVILANNRPFEGLLLAIPLAVWIGRLIARQWENGATRMVRRTTLSLALILSAGAGITLYYNLRVTGHSLVFPYQLYEKTYAVSPAFLWAQPNLEPDYHHDVMREWAHGTLYQFYFYQKSAKGIFLATLYKLNVLRRHYLGLLLMVPLVFLPWTMKRGGMRTLAGFLLVMIVGVLSETWVFPHYIAPGYGLIFAVVLGSMRNMRCFCYRGKRMGLALSRSIVVFSLVLVLYPLATRMGVNPKSWSLWRADAIKELTRRPDQHLILVRYQAGHNTDLEWVYNDADIDSSRVIWAREMDLGSNLKLFQYFRKRRIWLLEADKLPLVLRPIQVEQ